MKKYHLPGVLFFIPLVAILTLSSQPPDYDTVYLGGSRIMDPPFLDTTDGWVDSVYRSLSGDERIAQLLMIAVYPDQGPEHIHDVARLIEKHHVGGIVLFKGAPYQYVTAINHLQAAAKTPLLVAVDAEWGLGMRIDSTISYPRQMMLGAIRDDQLIYQMGYDIAGQLKRMGIYMNFAPVMDVNNNPDNPVINSRSFGEDEKNVTVKGMDYIRGMQDAGILCTAKHFPGHGDTDVDSHYALPTIPHSRDRLESVELYPFIKAIEQGLSGVMVAHLNVPALDTTNGLASSLSHGIINDLLKEELGFKGLVVTDALNMKGVSDTYEPGQLEARALLAGNDILLMPSDIPKAIRVIKREIRKKNISNNEIGDRCKKIVAAKKWVGLNDYKPVPLQNLYEDLHQSKYELTRSSLVESAITLLVNEDHLIPFARLDTLKIASLSIGSDTVTRFQQHLNLYSQVDHFMVPKEIPIEEADRIVSELDSYNMVVVGVHNTDMRVTRQYGITDQSIRLIQRISTRNNVILTVFANPYSLKRFGADNKMKSLLMAYEDNEITQQFAAQLIFGGIPARGLLPVTVNSIYKAGYGLDTEEHYRLKYSLPEAAGMDSRILEKIDSLVYDAIEQEAIPGCQVLAARDGLVFYHKAFGYHTYAKKNPVKLTDLYDLASVTKITATLPSVMKLSDEGRLNIEDCLSRYLPYLDTSNKGDLIIKEILAHQARLLPWIPFYYSTLETLNPAEPLIDTSLSSKYPFKLSEHVYLNKNLKYVENAYDSHFSEDYPFQVAHNLYLNRNYRDTIFHKLIDSELLEEKEYKYSDLGFYFMQMVVEDLTDSSLYDYVDHNFYKYLGANTLGFLPLLRFSPERIVPTENDVYFRRQLLRGYVHDPGTAMLGGIGGHAGLFSNANDLAKIMQMYLQKGYYAGKRYLREETIDLFNTCFFCGDGNRRGLGFDKPEMDYDKEGPTCQCVSASSFGHTGFTGTMAWVDPETGILYIFFSNRIHPDQDNVKLSDMNVRTNVQQVIYDALKPKTEN